MTIQVESKIPLQKITSRNPATSEVLCELDCADKSQVNAVVLRARAAQPAWAELGAKRRLVALREFQAKVYADRSRIAAAITREAGKPVAESLTTEVLIVLDACRFLIDNASRLVRDEPLPHGNLAARLKQGKLVREPYGVIAIISPWNYPFAIPATEALAALAAGNAVVLKPSEATPLVALELARLLHSAGVPEAIFQVVLGEGPTGAALLHSSIDKLFFTGSVATGRRIASMAAERLLPIVLELGGKDPMLVLDDADVDVASSAAVWGAFLNAGQTCLSVERCYVHRRLHDAFADACTKKTGHLHVGSGIEPDTDVGPMIHERQVRIVEEHIADAKARGAEIRIGGTRRLELGTNFYAPTVLTGVTHEMRIMREETFGPVLPIMPFADDDEALRLANESEYGLSASVWTSDSDRGDRIARRIHAGTVMVNDVVSCFGISEAPHGGIKSSGFGRTHGRFGLEEVVRLKYLDSDLMPGMKKLWWYRYGKDFRRNMESFMDLQFASNVGRRFAASLKVINALRRKQL